MTGHGKIGQVGLAVCGLAMLSESALAQTSSLKKQLVGAWTITSVTVQQKGGQKLDPWGANSKGMVIFTNDGHFSIINTRGDLPKLAAGNRLKGTADEDKALAQGSLAYFGTYTVDDAARTVTTRIDRSSYPNDDGSAQTRPITLLTADELHMTNPTGSVGGAVAEVVATRAK